MCPSDPTLKLNIQKTKIMASGPITSWQIEGETMETVTDFIWGAPKSRVRSLGREDPLEKEMVTHSSILAWKIPWMEKPGRLQSMGSQRVGHDRATSLSCSSKTRERVCSTQTTLAPGCPDGWGKEQERAPCASQKCENSFQCILAQPNTNRDSIRPLWNTA